MSVRNLLNVVGLPRGNSELLKEFHSTHDIINAVVEQHKINRNDARKFAASFDAGTDYQVCEKLWRFVRTQLLYKAEGDDQNVKTISKILYDATNKKGNDCKHFAGFSGVVLDALDIPCFYRFACYDNSGLPTHVYPVAIIGNNEVILDSV